MQNGSPTALITGATSGIGYELARLFARDRYNLVLVARSDADLRRTADAFSSEFDIAVQTIAQDLSTDGAARKVVDAVGGARIDVLVNDAGFATYGPFVDLPVETTSAMLHVNMVSLTELTRLFGAPMAARRSGRILNVASTAAFQPGPLMAAYYASKSYVLLLSEALAYELEPSGVAVSVLCPGPTRTRFQQRAGMERSKLFDYGVMDAETVARIGYQSFKKGKTLIIPGLRNKLMAMATRLGPRKLLPRIVLQMQRPA